MTMIMMTTLRGMHIRAKPVQVSEDEIVELVELDFEKSEAVFQIREGSRWVAGQYRINAINKENRG